MEKRKIGVTIVFAMIIAGIVTGCKKESNEPPTMQHSEESTKLEQFQEELDTYNNANLIENVLKSNNSVKIEYLKFGSNSDVTSSMSVYANNNQICYTDNTGRFDYLRDDEWVGFNTDEKEVFKTVFVDKKKYTDEWNYLKNMSQFSFDNMTITDSIESNNGYDTVIRSKILDKDDIEMLNLSGDTTAEIGDKYIDKYIFDTETKLFLSENISIKPATTEEKQKYSSITAYYDDPVEIDDGILEMVEEKDRTCTVHIDVDEGCKDIITEQAGEGTAFVFALPEGYTNVYTDNACKNLLENQNLTGDLDVYISKGL